MEDVVRNLTPPENTACDRCGELADPINPRWRRGRDGWEHQCKDVSGLGTVGEGISHDVARKK